uniref:DNA polymerase alpha subunit B n=1 Tax=Parastrongyloides trichosuri TaxID=131310 RepID=A0A0N5A4V8_PARTI
MDDFEDIENEFLGLSHQSKPNVLCENKNYPIEDYNMDSIVETPQEYGVSTPPRKTYSAVRTPRSHMKVGSTIKNILEHYGSKYKRPPINEVLSPDINILSNQNVKSYRYGGDKIVDMIDFERENYEKFFDMVDGYKDDVIIGRIISNLDEPGRITDKSVSILTRDEIVPLDFDEMQKISLFPGKIVIYKGIKELKKFKVTDEIEIEPLEHYKYTGIGNKNDLAFVIYASAGPYSLPDSCDFSPLYSLIDIAIKDKVSVLLLMGPFIGENQFYDDDIDHNTYLEYLFKQIYNHINGTKLKILIVPNVSGDVTCLPVYPTPPFNLNESFVKNVEDRILFLSDPSTFTINGVVFASTSADVLLHLSKSDFYRSDSAENENRVDRLTSYIFSQRSLYPIFPPIDDFPFIQSRESMEKIKLNKIPHVIFIPSQLPQSIRLIKDCLCINIGKLLRNGFAKLSFNLLDANEETTLNPLQYAKAEFFELEQDNEEQ